LKAFAEPKEKSFPAKRRALHAQDVTNLLMMTATVLMALATAFCALASWRMAHVSSADWILRSLVAGPEF
jgi:hypothetical protein